ncbi:hypothetical protein GKZ68_06800 [Hymenobacter sp. BRD128]|uniref:hypothetical protein n=1 Tax=Hymenobacter sp. BRD128 TaxID=2675878 RepID=UPI001563C4B1|nr:hypothetical protein [Hymenobacter sp. BRD128]QKG56368.1 hypothetical protein GKZ68_06800 [Hymenobacter sp. BRD128]
MPSLHNLAFADDTTLAPGLVVGYHSIPRADTAIVGDPGDIKIAFTIRQSGKEIYRDTTDGLAYDLSVLEPLARHLYPLWIPTGPGRGELLIAYDNRPLKALARRFFIEPDRVAHIDTLLTFDGPARDVDHDGRAEFSGFYSWGEQWEDTRGRRRMYIPTLYYEVRPSGLVLDSALTQRKAKAQYGAFYGYKDSDIKTLTNQSFTLNSELPRPTGGAFSLQNSFALGNR